MKIFVWGTAVLLAILWTAGVAIAVEVVQWSVGAIASGGVAGITETVARIPLPEWIAPVVDLFGGRETLAAAASWLQTVSTMLPSASQSLGWVVPALWVVWGLGLVGLLIVTVVVSRFVRI